MKIIRIFLLAAVIFCSLAMHSCSDPYEEIKLQNDQTATDPHSNGNDNDRD